MNEWLENETDRRLINMLFNIVEFLNLFSYMKGSLKRPRAIPAMMTQDKT